MPGTVLDLKNKLTGAIDREGNVRDMAAVLEVIGLLEQTTVTAEELQVSRLGKYVNSIRKQTKEKSLARRIKQLLKAWQKLANSATTPNGFQPKAGETPASAIRSVSPESQAAIPIQSQTAASTSSSTLQVPAPTCSTIAPSSPPTVNADCSCNQKVPGSTSDPVVNRLKKRSLFSAVKKAASPQPPTTTTTITTTTTTPPSNTSGITSHLSTSSTVAPGFVTIQQRTSSLPPLQIEDITPVEPAEPSENNRRQLTSADSSNAVDRFGIELHSSDSKLSTNLPLLMVRFPVSHPVNSALGELNEDKESSFIVSIPRHLVQTRASAAGAQPTSPELPLSLIVRINKQCFTSVPSNDRLHPVATQGDGHASKSLPELPEPDFSTWPDLPTSESVNLAGVSSTGAPSGRLKLPTFGIPEGCIDGVDGCLGPSGVWYEWTEYIPSVQETAVTVLPYVYVDGWDLPS